MMKLSALVLFLQLENEIELINNIIICTGH